MLNHLTYNGQEFVIKSTNKEWIAFKYTFNSYTPGSVRIEIVEKNTEVDRWPYERGGSDLFWIKMLDLEKTFSAAFKTLLYSRGVGYLPQIGYIHKMGVRSSNHANDH